MADYRKFLQEGFENSPVHLDFVQKVEAYKSKYSRDESISTMEKEVRATMVIEAVKLYEEFFKGKERIGHPPNQPRAKDSFGS